MPAAHKGPDAAAGASYLPLTVKRAVWISLSHESGMVFLERPSLCGVFIGVDGLPIDAEGAQVAMIRHERALHMAEVGGNA